MDQRSLSLNYEAIVISNPNMRSSKKAMMAAGALREVRDEFGWSVRSGGNDNGD